MIHHVFANRSNIGDWLSARGIQCLLQPHEVVEHLCDEPYVSETLSELKSTTRDDLIVIGGGGLFMDYFEPFWEGFRAIAERVPFVIWGVGYCDMKHAPSRPSTSLLEAIAAQSQLCQVRDELTRSYLQNCDLPAAVICPSITMVSGPTVPRQGLLYSDAYDNVGPAVYKRTVATLKKYAALTGRSYLQTNNIIAKGNESQLEKTLRLYAAADLVIASRLHGCILGAAMGCRVLAISGDRKIESFMHTIGLEDWILDLKQIEDLPARLDTLPGQDSPEEFIVDARLKNRAFAKHVKALAEKSQNVPQIPLK